MQKQTNPLPVAKPPFWKSSSFWRQTGIFWVLIALCIAMAVSQPNFLTSRNIINILKQVSINGILAMGMSIILISGGIDLSMGSIVAVTCVASAYLAQIDLGLPLWLPFVAAIGIGTFLGMLNGLGIGYLGYAPFIMTLAMMTMARGAVLLFTDSKPVFNLQPAFIDISNSFLFGMPSLVYFFLAVFLLTAVILRRTVFGKWVYAVGGNESATRLSGINTRRVKVIIYSYSGMLCGLAGLLLASRITSGNPRVGDGYEMDAIAASVIGGVSMSGGLGKVWGTLIGVLLLGVIQNGFDILGLSTYYQQIMKGVIILFAVLIDMRARRKSAR